MSLFPGCYSFTGGTLPDYLDSVYIANVTDNSGFGNPIYSEILTNFLFKKFREDNSLKVVDSGGDTKLTVKISSIIETKLTVQTGELESERKVVVSCNVDFYDSIKNKISWKKNFQNFNTYAIAEGQSGRDNAIKKALEQISDDILLAVVSGW